MKKHTNTSIKHSIHAIPMYFCALISCGGKLHRRPSSASSWPRLHPCRKPAAPAASPRRAGNTRDRSGTRCSRTSRTAWWAPAARSTH
nr:hypothetical protein Iba_chr12bCG20830 [Ipomoea batatas]